MFLFDYGAIVSDAVRPEVGGAELAPDGHRAAVDHGGADAHHPAGRVIHRQADVERVLPHHADAVEAAVGRHQETK